MPFIVAAIVGALLMIVSSIVGRTLLALGLSFVMYQGIDTAMGWLFDQIKGNMSAIPQEVLGFLAWLWVDKALQLLFSTYVAVMTIRMAGGSSILALVFK